MAKALFYIMNIRTLAAALLMQKRISAGGGQAAIPMLKQTPLGRARINPADAARCVNLAIRIGARFGLLDSCLTRSAILCILLRRAGLDAKTAFALNKNGGILEGHCWIVCEECGFKTDGANRQYQDVMLLP